MLTNAQTEKLHIFFVFEIILKYQVTNLLMQFYKKADFTLKSKKSSLSLEWAIDQFYSNEKKRM